ncbi:MAG: PLD nuclease N-terminal domain-containing protein [Candidatus Aenigmatarchaeota archaeon]
MAEFEYLIDLGFVVLQIYGIVSIIAFIPAMIDILKSKKSTKYKLVWLAICLILGVFGVLVYFLIEKKMLRFDR